MKPLANSIAPGLSRWSPTNLDTEIALKIRLKLMAEDTVVVGYESQRELKSSHFRVADLLHDPVPIGIQCGIDSDNLSRLEIHHCKDKNLESLDIDDARKVQSPKMLVSPNKCFPTWWCHAARSSTINRIFGVAQPFEAIYQGRRKSSKKSLALINAVLQVST